MEIYTAMNDPHTLNIEPKKQIGKHNNMVSFVWTSKASKDKQYVVWRSHRGG